jgi:hypothetical protein
MVGGLDKCIAVFYNARTQQNEILSSDEKITILNYSDVAFIEAIRSSKKQVNWIKKEQVPFEIGKKSIEQLSFMDEEESSVLELRFKNFSDNQYDVLYFYFKNNIGNFKLSSVNEAMAVDVKGVIQRMLYNQICLIINTNNQDSKIHKQIGDSLSERELQGKITHLENEKLTIAKSNYTYLLIKITEKEIVDFRLSSSAVQVLSDLRLNMGEVEGVLRKSIELIINKYNPIGFYDITSNDLHLETQKNKTENFHKARDAEQYKTVFR